MSATHLECEKQIIKAVYLCEAEFLTHEEKQPSKYFQDLIRVSRAVDGVDSTVFPVFPNLNILPVNFEDREDAGLCEDREDAGLCEDREDAGLCEDREDAGLCVVS